MSDQEEPRFTTLKERIAALNQQKNFQAAGPPGPAIRKPPPPPPPRPARTQSETQPEHVENVAADARAHDAGSAPSPVLPPRPVRPAAESKPPPLPRRTTTDEQINPPPLPTRQTAPAAPPQLPPRPVRAVSAQVPSNRRTSGDSDASGPSSLSKPSLSRSKTVASTTPSDNTQRRRLPPTLDQAKLPPLPPSRREAAEKAKSAANTTQPSQSNGVANGSKPPSLPPRLPTRPSRSSLKPDADAAEPAPALPVRKLPPPPPAVDNTNPKPKPKSALEWGFRPNRRSPSPPPLPLSTRPTADQIEAAIAAPRIPPRPSTSQPQSSCLLCRDFSAPDAIAAQHPTSAIPPHARSDPVAYLAHVLCSPFPSATDKARAIFTWCHHNIDYDVDGFFGRRAISCQRSPADTIFSGSAVCEGYARVYQSIAQRAGLECLVVSGHGKGFGFKDLKESDPIPPPDISGHAWNAVRIDGGRWKLIDPCWGAGAVSNDAGVGPKYTRRFAPEFFTMPNRKFAWRHHPENPQHWFLNEDGDGQGPDRLTWEEYVLGPAGLKGEPAQWMSTASREGLDPTAVEPAGKHIHLSHYSANGVVQFRVRRVCPHWTPERNGPGPALLMALRLPPPSSPQQHGSFPFLNGQTKKTKKDMLLLQDLGGGCFGIDVPAADLMDAAPGQREVVLVAIDKVDGLSARGMTPQQWMEKWGRCGFHLEYLVRWEMV
ncbi:hypothetical protein VTJ04DRAFT_4441 [Mycothermus thermophilus]|uniref:uncharacterized protein n=1 Tax=Humicola insolens TaxID=85995 RepID=UPI0037421099